MSKLIILEGPDAGAKFSFDSGRLLIGRGDECQIRINQGSISRHHAALTFMENCWQIEDLNSQNGVFIDGVQISRQQLTQNTRIRLGTINVVRVGGNPELRQVTVLAILHNVLDGKVVVEVNYRQRRHALV